MMVKLKVNQAGDWQCPQCQNDKRELLTVIRRTCGYLGENFWNEGRTKEIGAEYYIFNMRYAQIRGFRCCEWTGY